MPGVYKIPMVRMAAMPDETPECKGLKVPHTEMYVWVHAQTVRSGGWLDEDDDWGGGNRSGGLARMD